MTAAKRDLYIEQGATFQLGFVWYDGDVNQNGSPVDLTGAQGRMQIRKAQQQPSILDAVSFGPTPQITLYGNTGKIVLNLTPVDTNRLTLKSALYDFEVEFADGRVYRLLEGKVTVSPNITQFPADPPVDG
jgi:hypothetical protein